MSNGVCYLGNSGVYPAPGTHTAVKKTEIVDHITGHERRRLIGRSLR